MNIFNYIFYRISNIYIKTGIETQRPDVFSGGLVTLFQGFNLITLLYFIFSVRMTSFSWVYIGLPLMVLNWIFFFNFRNLKKFHLRWNGEDKHKRQVKGIFIVAYLLATILLFILALSKY
jgi:hypothetical protein